MEWGSPSLVHCRKPSAVHVPFFEGKEKRHVRIFPTEGALGQLWPLHCQPISWGALFWLWNTWTHIWPFSPSILWGRHINTARTGSSGSKDSKLREYSGKKKMSFLASEPVSKVRIWKVLVDQVTQPADLPSWWLMITESWNGNYFIRATRTHFRPTVSIVRQPSLIGNRWNQTFVLDLVTTPI